MCSSYRGRSRGGRPKVDPCPLSCAYPRCQDGSVSLRPTRGAPTIWGLPQSPSPPSHGPLDSRKGRCLEVRLRRTPRRSEGRSSRPKSGCRVSYPPHGPDPQGPDYRTPSILRSGRPSVPRALLLSVEIRRPEPLWRTQSTRGHQPRWLRGSRDAQHRSPECLSPAGRGWRGRC